MRLTSGKTLVVIAVLALDILGAASTSASARTTRVTTYGRVAGLNLASRTFSVVRGGYHLPVNAWGARITFRGHRANLNRLMGSPYVRVTGSRRRGSIVYASSVQVMSRPTARLMSSHYTRMATPSHPAIGIPRHGRR